MIPYPDINPVAIELGPLKVHWYGLMYLVGFAAAWWLGVKRARAPHSPLKPEQISDLIFYGALGVIIGGRLGYMLFYNFGAYIENPLHIFRVWEGGMSFHGGLLGVGVALYLYSRKVKQPMFKVWDFVAPLSAIGFLAGRIGNFINGELWGRVTDVPWGMVFPHAGDLPRHPSQLYQAFMEGLLLFIILWIYTKKPRPTMSVTGLFLICYGFFRFLAEFARQPDEHLGYLAFGWVTMGQVLSLPMIIGGLLMMIFAYKREAAAATQK